MNTTDEMVDVVDEKDTVLRTVSKSQAHKEGLLHRTVVAEVIDSQGRWILVKQAGDRQDAGQYVSPVGGHVSAGESEVAALHREALEEMGLKEFSFQFIGKDIFARHVLGRHENHLFILYEITTSETPTLNHESVGYQAFTKEDLKKKLKENPKLFGDAFHFVVGKFYQNLLE